MRDRTGPKQRGPGRPKGSRNKITTTVRERALEAFDRAGGADFFYRLANSPRMPERICFANIIGRFVPIEVHGQMDHALTVHVVKIAQADVPANGTCVIGETARVAPIAAPNEGEIAANDPEAGT